MLASEQFVTLAHTLLRSRASPTALAVIFPGNPSYADDAQLEELANQALEEIVARFKVYPS